MPKFVKGKSGNPNGRPKGSRNQLTIIKEAILTSTETKLLQNLDRIVDVLVEEAKKGNIQAAKMLLDRVWPAMRAVEIRGKDGGDIKVTIQKIGHELVQDAIEDAEVID